MQSFILAFLTILPLKLFATGQESVMLGEQPYPPDNQINGNLQVTGNPFQTLTLCAKQVRTDSIDSPLLAVSETANISTILLLDGVVNFSISGDDPCPEEVTKDKDYHWRQIIYSDQPFLVTQRLNNASEGCPVTGLFFPDKPVDDLTMSGGAGGSADDTFFQKKPPFMPVPTKGDFSLTLLPVLRLTTDWQQYLPGTHWWHWLLGEPEEDSGITLQLRFDGLPPLVLRISQSEFTEFSEHLQDTRLLLQWLTPKLNGYEAFVHKILALQQIIASLDSDDSNEIQTAVHQQLVMILEQPQTEFRLELETAWLAHILESSGKPPEGLTAADNPDTKKDKKGRFASNNPSSGGKQTRQKQTTGPSDLQGTPEHHELNDLMGAQDFSGTAQRSGEGRYVLWINGHRFYIRDKKIQHNPDNYRDLRDKHVTVTNDQDREFHLSEVEKKAGLPEQDRLYRLTREDIRTQALDYLLYYGTTESLRAYFNNHFPQNLTPAEAQEIAQEMKHDYPQEHRHVLNVVMSQLFQRPAIAHLKRPVSGYATLLFYSVRHELTATTGVLLQFASGHPDLQVSVTNNTDVAGNSLLHMGATQSSRMMALLLRHLRTRLNRKNREGNTPIHIALLVGHFENARLLYEAGSNPDITAGHRRKRTLRQLYPPSADEQLSFLKPRSCKKLHAPEQFRKAVEENNLTDLFIWLENRPDINIVFQCKTPIQIAAAHQRPEIIRLLYEYDRYKQLETVITQIELNDLRVLVHKLETLNGVISRTEANTAIYEAAFNHEGGMLSLVRGALETFQTEYLRPLIQAQEAKDVEYIISQLVEQHNLSVSQLRLSEKSRQAIRKQCFSSHWQIRLLRYQQFIENLLEQGDMEAIIRRLKDEPDLLFSPVTGVPFAVQVKRVIPEIARELYDYAQQLTGHQQPSDLLTASLSNNPSKTPLALASATGSLPTVDVLLSLHNNYPDTRPLHIAVQKQNRALVLKLLANGIKEKNAEKRAGLVAMASTNGNTDIARALETENLEELFRHLARSPIHQVASQKGKMPSMAGELLHIAVETGEQHYVDRVLEWLPGKEVFQSINSVGKTPLEAALDRGYTDIARTLFARDQGVQLFVAVRKGKFKRLRQFAEIGAELGSLQDSCSLLYTAVENNQVEIVRWLLGRLPAAFITRAAASCQNPLTLARSRRYQSIIDLLERRGQ